jgi:hypothetical protein
MNTNEITLTEAVALTHAYQLDPNFVNQPVAFKTDNSTILEIINQPGCVQIRTYMAKDDLNKLTLVMVGVDQNGNDITSGKIMDRFVPCPHNCSNNSPLMLPS